MGKLPLQILFLAAIGHTAIAAKKLSPTITGFGHQGCFDAKQTLQVNGKHFGVRTGNNRLVIITGQSDMVEAKILYWSESVIRAKLPASDALSNSLEIGVAIQDIKSGFLISNFKSGIKICKAPPSSSVPITNVETGPVVQAPTGETDTPATNNDGNDGNDCNDGNDDNDSNDCNDVPTVDKPTNDAPKTPTPADLPNGSGSLLTRQSPNQAPIPTFEPSEQAPSGEYEPNQLLVISSDINQATELAKRLRSQRWQIKSRRRLDSLGMVLTVFRIPSSVTINAAKSILQRDFAVVSAPNQRYTLQANHSKTDNRKRFAQKMIGLEDRIGKCRQAIRIGVIDTAVNEQHVALKGRSITQNSLLPPGSKSAPVDHGTAIAGLLIGDQQLENHAGLVPSAQLYVAEAFRQQDKRIDATAESLLRALDWLISNKVSVINLSLGGSYNPIIQTAVNQILKRGILLIASAGNGGPRGKPVYPAAHDGVLAVTAVDVQHKLYRKANLGNYIDFAAPGVDIWVAATNNKGAYRSGTSFATPFVTAIAAISKTEYGTTNALKRLRTSAIDLGKHGRDKQFGWGLIQADFKRCR